MVLYPNFSEVMAEAPAQGLLTLKKPFIENLLTLYGFLVAENTAVIRDDLVRFKGITGSAAGYVVARLMAPIYLSMGVDTRLILLKDKSSIVPKVAIVVLQKPSRMSCHTAQLGLLLAGHGVMILELQPPA